MDRLARRLRDAVTRNGGTNGNGSNGSRGESARRIAVEVGATMLAEANRGTAEHSDDVVLITEAIGERMGISGDAAGDLLAAARLHDIGKAWIPSDLLEKAGPLTEEEWEVMRQHTVVGERILGSVDGLREVGRLVRHSHERWDGAGYPDGLTGSDIPLGSRIIFCADAFHAIRCDRPYRAGRSAREAVTEINRCAGTQFDPRVAGALEQVVRERNRRPRGVGGSSRLFALLMCLVVAGAGTAIARSGLTQELPISGASVSRTAPPPPGCGTAACPGVAGPVGWLNAVGALNGEPGPRPVSPGLPGHRHRHKHGAKGGPQGGEGNHGKGKKAKGNHGKSARAHAQRGSHGNGDGSQGSSGSSGVPHSSGYGGSSSSSGGGGSGGHSSSHSSGGHGSSSHGSASHGSSSHGGGYGSSSSQGNAGGNSGAHGK